MRKHFLLIVALALAGCSSSDANRIMLCDLTPGMLRSDIEALYGAGSNGSSQDPFELRYIFLDDSNTQVEVGVSYEDNKASIIVGLKGAWLTLPRGVVKVGENRSSVLLKIGDDAEILGDDGIVLAKRILIVFDRSDRVQCIEFYLDRVLVPTD